MLAFRSKQVLLSNIILTPVQTGFQARGKAHRSFLDRETENTGGVRDHYNLIQVKDTVRSVLYQIKSACLDKIFIPKKSKKFMNKYLIQKNDVLYLSKLKPGAFRYTEFMENTIPMAHFYILRPKSKMIDSDYLCWVLNQDFIQPYIQRHLKGTALPFISKDSLMNLKIPLPGIAIQKKIISLLKLRMREKEIQDIMERKKTILINTALKGLL